MIARRQAVTSLMLLFSSQACADEGWQLSPPLAPAVQQSKSRSKLLLLKVGTRWCPSCRKLDQIIDEKNVRRGLAGFLRLAYDAEEGEGKDVAERYNVIAYPTLLLVGGDGHEVGRITGDMPGPELLRAIEKIRSGAESLARLEQEAAKRPGDLQLRLRIGSEWAFRGSRARACAHLDAVVAADPQNRKGLAAKALLARGKYLLLRSIKDNAAAAETLRTLRAQFPSAPEAEQALYSLAIALHRLGKSAEAMKLVESRAGNAEQHDDVAWFCLRERTAYRVGLRHAQRATALDPKQASYWANLAELQLRLGDRQNAETSWARSRSLDPGYPRTRRSISALQP